MKPDTEPFKYRLRYPLRYRLKKLKDGSVVMQGLSHFKDDKLNEWTEWEDIETVDEADLTYEV